jgi:hypothetical protein
MPTVPPTEDWQLRKAKAEVLKLEREKPPRVASTTVGRIELGHVRVVDREGLRCAGANSELHDPSAAVVRPRSGKQADAELLEPAEVRGLTRRLAALFGHGR